MSALCDTEIAVVQKCWLSIATVPVLKPDTSLIMDLYDGRNVLLAAI